MNKALLLEKMRAKDIKAYQLASALNIVRQTFSCKLNGYRGDFTLSEVVEIKHILDLTDEEVIEIFFAEEVS